MSNQSSQVNRYHPLLVVLHWLMAVMLIVALIAGGAVLDPIPNDDPEKVGALKGHMIVGLSIGVLLLIRLLVRWKTRAPAHVDTGNTLIDRGGRLAHLALYVLIGVMVVSGIGMSVLTGLGDIVFGANGAAIPESLESIPPRVVHGIASKLLLALIILHVLAALWHQFLRRDGLMSRMGFGRN